jgi:hypothetical protein
MTYINARSDAAVIPALEAVATVGVLAALPAIQTFHGIFSFEKGQPLEGKTNACYFSH